MTTRFAKQANTAIALNAQRRIPQSTRDAMVKIEGISSPIIKCSARVDFVKNGVSVAAGQTFYLVASSKFAGYYYVVVWNEDRTSWQCSCGADCRQHAHTVAVKSFIVDHVVRPKLEADPMKAKIAQAIDVLRQQAIAANDQPAPQTKEEWKAALAKQKEADRQYKRAYIEAARSLRNSA